MTFADLQRGEAIFVDANAPQAAAACDIIEECP
jgi:hypothetical protein